MHLLLGRLAWTQVITSTERGEASPETNSGSCRLFDPFLSVSAAESLPFRWMHGCTRWNIPDGVAGHEDLEGDPIITLGEVRLEA